MPRTSCIWIPHFELNTRLLSEPSLADAPLIIADVSSVRATVIDASKVAEELGIRRRMPIGTARALCPEVVILPPAPALVRQFSEKILVALYQLAPLIGRDNHDSFFLTLSGLKRLHPDEERLTQRLAKAIQAFSLPAIVVIADSPLTAWIVTRSPEAKEKGRIIVPQGEDREFLAQLPIEALPMPDNISRLCRLLGIDQVAELQKLPAGALLRRFGKGGAELEQRIHARAGDLFRQEVPLIIEEAELHLDNPVADLEVLLFLHKNVLDRLIRQVVHSRQAIATLNLELKLCDSERSVACQEFRPAQPSLNSRVILDLIGLWLSSAPLPHAVDSIRMQASEVAVATQRQLRLFDRQQEIAGDALNEAISRLSAAFGPEAVVRPTLKDRHLPEARLDWLIVKKSSDLPPVPVNVGEMLAPTPPVLSLLSPPLEVQLRPPNIRRARWIRLAKENATRKILRRQGPFSIEGEWWNNGFCRDYMLLVTAEDHCWVFAEGTSFYLHAYLD